MQHQSYVSYRIEPPLEFSEIVTHFYVARNEGSLPVTKTLIPTFQAILIFNFGAPGMLLFDENTEAFQGKCLVLGPIKKPLGYTLAATSEIFVVNFKDDAFYRFFGNVMHGLDAPKNPDDFLENDCFEQLWQKLLQVGSDGKRIELLLDFCQPYLEERDPIASQLTSFDDETQNEVKAIAADLKLTERTIQKAYKKRFGFTAKEKARYQRFLRVIRDVGDATTNVDWQQLTHRHNYYDQSHLIRDFKLYLGVSPQHYLKLRNDMCMGRP